MKFCILSELNGNLPDKIDKCDTLIIIGNFLPNLDGYRLETWLVRQFINWINSLSCANCICCYNEFSSSVTPIILQRIYKSTKYKIEFSENLETNLITENGFIKLWLGKNYNDIPKFCDIVITLEIPNDKVITESRRKTDGNVELAKVIKKQCPKIVISKHTNNSELIKKKNCNTLFGTVLNLLYFEYEE